MTTKTINSIKRILIADLNRPLSHFERQFKNCGQKKKDRNVIKEEISQISMPKRQTYCSVAARTSVSRSTIMRMKKEGSLRCVRSAVRLFLTNETRMDRVEFAMEQLQVNKREFQSMEDVIHIDEKWFSLTKVNRTFILTPDEEPPHRSVQSKHFIPKVMFLCAVARPRAVGDDMFDGKIGIWPFAKLKPAVNSSRNRPAGTLEWKEETINKQTYTDMIKNKLLPAIQDKFPHNENTTVRIQHDNATPHRAMDAEDVEEYAMEEHGIRVEFEFQPAQSPDMNVLDLGFFNSLQSHQQERLASNVQEIINNVTAVYNAYPPEKLNDVFLTLQTVLEEVILKDGSNRFKIPHLGKEKLSNAGMLPHVVELRQATRDKVQEHLAAEN